jgi:integrase
VYLGIGTDGKKKNKWYGGFRTKKEAEIFLAAHVNDINRGVNVAPTKQTVKEFLIDWLKMKKEQVRPNTYLGYEGKMRQHVFPTIGEIKLKDLKPQHLQTLYTNLSATLSNRSIVHVHRILHDALDRAVKWGMLAQNVAAHVSPPRPVPVEMTVWDADQVRTFLDYVRESANSRYYSAYFLAIVTGMRLGELLGLKWSDINLNEEYLTVSRTLTFVTGEPLELPTKTPKSHRIIALPSETIEVLKAHKLLQARDKALLQDEYHDQNYVVTKENGDPPHSVSFREMFQKAIVDSGVPRIRFHDLRHTHASLLLAQGVHPKIVSERLGHATVGITLDIYTHIFPNLQQKTAKEFGNFLFGSDVKNDG